MRSTAVRHVLSCLAHPLSLLAASALLANALLFQRLWPSWWTGKLGDAMWMVFAPFGVALIIVVAAPRWAAVHRRATGLVSIAVVGAGFAALKAIPVVNALALQTGTALGFSLKLLHDPTDLLALPVLGVAWWIWDRPQLCLQHPSLRAGAAILCGLALLADSPASIPLGITCVGETGGKLYAVEESTEPKKDSAAFGNMLSSDDGLEWTLLGVAQEVVDEAGEGRRWRTTALKDAQIEVACGTAGWPVVDPANPDAQLYFAPGSGIYSSSDNGTTLILSLATTEQEFTGKVVHSGTGNLILTNLHTLLVRTPDGEWIYGVCKQYSCRLVVTPTP